MFSVILYLFAIVLANLSVLWFGPASTIINAFFLIGLDLTLRDKLHDKWMDNNLWLKMFLLIIAGSAITFLVAPKAGHIAAASVISFACAALADAIVYSLLHKKNFMIRSNGSNLGGSLVDSVLFPTIAFGSLMPWIIFGQFTAKVTGGFLWSLILNYNRKKKAV
ncbi:MAG: VUT family protein [Syntrophothermus sp.]